MNLLSCAKPHILCDTTAPSLYPPQGIVGARLWKLVAKAAESHRLEHESGLRLLSADRISEMFSPATHHGRSLRVRHTLASYIDVDLRDTILIAPDADDTTV